MNSNTYIHWLGIWLTTLLHNDKLLLLNVVAYLLKESQLLLCPSLPPSLSRAQEVLEVAEVADEEAAALFFAFLLSASSSLAFSICFT